MKTHLGSLFLIFALASGVLAGAPLHFDDSHCGMQDMSGNDCCTKAHQQVLTPDVAKARLCCVINCSQTEATTPPTSVRVTPPLFIDASPHPAVDSEFPTQPLSTELDSLHGPPKFPPVYLRTLTLLI